ncbi:MAG: phosphate ABC transporter substrate-binding protein PstS [Gemmatimonadota bacterium]
MRKLFLQRGCRVPLLFLAASLLVGCSGGGAEDVGSDDPPPGSTFTITGAGATFPYPIYSRWFSIYSQNNPVRVNYQSIGSGGGIRQMIEGTVDFGATDAPLADEDLDRIPGTLSLPMVLGSVVLTYNLPGLEAPLRLDGEAIAAIFLGELTRWRDPRILRLNPGVVFPDRDIIPAHRSDGSGTTYVFTDFLSEVSPAWRSVVGRGNAVRWPTGLGARGNEGVTGQVRQSPGAIGYVEQVFARQNDLPMAQVRNQQGEFVSPSTEATTRAASGLAERIPENDDFRLSIVNAEAPGAYPISSWTYILLPPHFPDCRLGRAVGDLLVWALLEGDEDVRTLNYAPLSADMKERVVGALTKVTCGEGQESLFQVDPLEAWRETQEVAGG